MKIGRSTGYGLLAAAYIAQHQKEGIVLSQDIAKKYKIPLEYLLKILQFLVKANILRSKRGPRGGFTLAKPPKQVSLLQVIEAIDGPMESDLNLKEHAKGEKFTGKIERTYDQAIKQARQVFSKTKLSDLT